MWCGSRFHLFLHQLDQRDSVAYSVIVCLATAMTGTTSLEPSELETWTPQHWSRQEWFYMWTKGLDPSRIAIVCRVPYRKVYDYIRTTVTQNPNLFGQRLMVHDRPALPRGGLKKRRSWDQRCTELVNFHEQYGRLPRGYLEAESSLYSFLQYQREQYRAGKIPESRKSYLDEHVRGWLTPPKAERERALWEQRANETKIFVRAQGRYPKYKAAVRPSEKTLAVWLNRQRHCQRLGKLGNCRRQWLDDHLPGWCGESY